MASLASSLSSSSASTHPTASTPAEDGVPFFHLPSLGFSWRAPPSGSPSSSFLSVAIAPIPSLSLSSLSTSYYIHRTLIYPLVIQKAPASSSSRGLPFAVAFGFNLLNAYLQSRWITHYGNYTPGWLRTPKLAAGAAAFAIGMATNVWADRRLVALKREAGGGYKVPNGGLFELVSCPNYTGEIMGGWAGRF